MVASASRSARAGPSSALEVEPEHQHFPQLVEYLFGSRRSVRRYLHREVSAVALSELIDAARWAPSPHNTQPWRFAVLRERRTKRRVAHAMREAWRADLEADGLKAEEIDARLGHGYARLDEAPAAVIVFMDLSASDAYPDERRQSAEEVMAVQSIGAAVQNLLTAAHLRGLAACWMCAPLFCQAAITESLGLAPHLKAQALITVGYAAGPPKPPRARRPVADLVILDL